MKFQIVLAIMLFQLSFVGRAVEGTPTEAADSKAGGEVVATPSFKNARLQLAENEKRFDEHPNELTDAIIKKINERYSTPDIIKVKEKRDTSILMILIAPGLTSSNHRYKITLKNKWNDEFDVTYAFDGTLLEEDSHKIPFDQIPADVKEALKIWKSDVWKSDVKYDDFVEVKKESDKPGNRRPAIYKVRATLGHRNLEAKIQEDGTVIKADKLAKLDALP